MSYPSVRAAGCENISVLSYESINEFISSTGMLRVTMRGHVILNTYRLIRN